MTSKTILITGAGSGLGKGAAIGLAKKGYKVIATARQESQLEELAALAENSKLSIEPVRFDLNNLEDHQRISELYADKVDILVNNAAIGQSGPIAEVPSQLIRNVYEVNVFKTLDLTQLFAKSFVERGYGKIVFISSIAGFMSVPFLAPYVSSKHALEAIAKLMKDELAPLGVQVATINPGVFNTGFNDRMLDTMKAWYKPEVNFTPEEHIDKVREMFAADGFQLDPQDMVDFIVDVIPKEHHNFRNVYPEQCITEGREYQEAIWTSQI